MTESKAVEDYNAFDSIRNRFGGARKTSADALNPLFQQKKAASKRNPRSTAPPLIPLVEESDVSQEELVHSELSSPVKGKWRHSSTSKVYGPDFDALETASIASGSSAYSSKSESSAPLSPLAGSMSELSDVSSTDTHFEYDLTTQRTSKTKPSRIASLRASFEKTKSLDQSDVRYHDIEISSEVVPGRTKAWNKFIGEWIFNGVEKYVPPSPVDRTRRISNEVRIPTPSSTPVYGSMENLIGSGSRSSILSSNPDEESEEEQNWNWTQESKHPLGKFINQHQSPRRRQRPSSACSLRSSQMSRVKREVLFETSSDTDLTGWAREIISLSPLVSSSADALQPAAPVQKKHEEESKSKAENKISLPPTQAKPVRRPPPLIRRASEPVMKITIPVPEQDKRSSEEEKDEFQKLQKITPAKSSKWLEAYKKYRSGKDKFEESSRPTTSPQEINPTIKEEEEEEEEKEEDVEEKEEVEVPCKIGQRVTVRSTKWRDAYQKYKTIKETSSDKPDEAAATNEEQEESEERASVEQRARMFGGMQRKLLKRSQSFQIGSRSNQQNRKPLKRYPSVVDYV